jgi:hypothetical protein
VRIASQGVHDRVTRHGPALAPALESGLALAVGALREAEKPLARPSDTGEGGVVSP